MAKKIESSELTNPDVGRENDTRGSEPHFVKRKIYMKGIEVACKHIKDPEDIDKEREEREKRKFQRLLAILIKASQSPNIIRFYGLSEVDGDKVMVLEWAQLGSLKEIYENEKKNNGTIPLEMKVYLFLLFFSTFFFFDLTL